MKGASCVPHDAAEPVLCRASLLPWGTAAPPASGRQDNRCSRWRAVLRYRHSLSFQVYHSGTTRDLGRRDGDRPLTSCRDRWGMPVTATGFLRSDPEGPLNQRRRHAGFYQGGLDAARRCVLGRARSEVAIPVNGSSRLTASGAVTFSRSY
jgi:hypothetical protein